MTHSRTSTPALWNWDGFRHTNQCLTMLAPVESSREFFRFLSHGLLWAAVEGHQIQRQVLPRIERPSIHVYPSFYRTTLGVSIQSSWDEQIIMIQKSVMVNRSLQLSVRGVTTRSATEKDIGVSCPDSITNEKYGAFLSLSNVHLRCAETLCQFTAKTCV